MAPPHRSNEVEPSPFTPHRIAAMAVVGAVFVGLMLFFAIRSYRKKHLFARFEDAQRKRAIAYKKEKLERQEKFKLKLEIPRSPPSMRRPLLTAATTTASTASPSPLRQAFSFREDEENTQTPGWKEVSHAFPNHPQSRFFESFSTSSHEDRSRTEDPDSQAHDCVDRATDVVLGRDIARQPRHDYDGVRDKPFSPRPPPPALPSRCHAL